MTSYLTVQNLIDEHTDEIPEGLYLQISKELMNAHRARTQDIEDAMNMFAEGLSRTVLASSGDEILNEIVGLRREVDSLRDELLGSRRTTERLRQKIEMYRSQITASSRKNEEYKKKIKELEIEKIVQDRLSTKKPTVVNPWVTHVRKWSVEHGLKYGVAVKDQRCKDAYWSVKRQATIN